MTSTRIHKTTRLEMQINERGGSRRYTYYVLFGINGDQTPKKNKLQKIQPELLAQLQEVHNQPKEEKLRDKMELDKALQILAKRIKPAVRKKKTARVKPACRSCMYSHFIHVISPVFLDDAARSTRP
jgi:hypothetical protein